jgi:hypothetical protein
MQRLDKLRVGRVGSIRALGNAWEHNIPLTSFGGVMKAVSSIWAKSLIAVCVIMSVSSMAAAATDVTGTWNLTQQGGGRRGGGGGGNGGNGGAGGAGGAGGGRAVPATVMTLKQDGDKLTGTIAFPAGRGRRGADQDPNAAPPPAPAPTEIKNGKIMADGTISFEVTQTRGQNEVTSKYTGKLDGDKMTGEVERPGRNGGDPTKTPWSAAKAAAKA